MGARAAGGGVEPLKASIRLRFTWSGKRRAETIQLPPTARNLLAAQRIIDTINAEIKAGTFVYARHFPDSKAVAEAKPVATFATFAARWLDTVTAEHGTKKGYESSLAKVWQPELGDKPLDAIRQSDIKIIVARRAAEVSAKTINNDLIPLRAVFDAAVADELIAASPARMIENLKHQSPLPDPFTPAEVTAILAYLRERSPVPVWAYYQFAFATGLRPSEQIVARWGKFSAEDRTIKIDTARTRNREKGTKTNTVRDVDLTAPAMEALTAMRPFTFLRETDAPIFCHPATGRPWTNDQYQRVTYFHPALKKLGIRKRDAYQTRHTYATAALMGGTNPSYVARQMGHANTGMLFKVYAKWIDGADNGRERAKLEASWPRIGHGEDTALEK